MFSCRIVSASMLLSRLACSPLIPKHASRVSIRVASTIEGASGRVYVQGEVLRRGNNDERPSIFKAECENKSFVFKRVSPSFFRLAQRLAAEFEGSRRLRMHIDHNQEQGILIYPYFKNTLLGLMQDDPDFPPDERKKILRGTGEAIQELHSKDWIHIDVKPDNILVDWTCDKEGNKTVTDVALGDFDIAFKLENGHLLQTPHAIGNAMWRSPEGQTGRGVTKASDIYSFGLLCVYALGGGDLLLLHDYQDLKKMSITPEQAILTRHFSYFGPVTEGLLKQIDSEVWSNALKGASAAAERTVKETPELKFECWGADLDPSAQDMISGMTRITPMDRLTIGQVMAHPWWHED